VQTRLKRPILQGSPPFPDISLSRNNTRISSGDVAIHFESKRRSQNRHWRAILQPTWEAVQARCQTLRRLCTCAGGKLRRYRESETRPVRGVRAWYSGAPAR
jgi:hypothetical protein